MSSLNRQLLNATITRAPKPPRFKPPRVKVLRPPKIARPKVPRAPRIPSARVRRGL